MSTIISLYESAFAVGASDVWAEMLRFLNILYFVSENNTQGKQWKKLKNH